MSAEIFASIDGYLGFFFRAEDAALFAAASSGAGPEGSPTAPATFTASATTRLATLPALFPKLALMGVISPVFCHFCRVAGQRNTRNTAAHPQNPSWHLPWCDLCSSVSSAAQAPTTAALPLLCRARPPTGRARGAAKTRSVGAPAHPQSTPPAIPRLAWSSPLTTWLACPDAAVRADFRANCRPTTEG